MQSVGSRLRHAWNAFQGQDAATRMQSYGDGGSGFGRRPDRFQARFTNERTIVASVYTRLGIDYSAVQMRHVRLDDQDRYLEDMDSPLNNVLTLDANLDQTGVALANDFIRTLFEEGCAALVPTDTSDSLLSSGSWEIHKMRAGKVVSWFPRHVRLSVYNEANGLREEIVLPKSAVAIVENPFYSIMNEPNSTLQRLIRTLDRLDQVDAQSASGKLDLIIQFPHMIKSDAKRATANQRRKELEDQLSGSKYGVAWADGTEKITQLNRAVENNLMGQVTYLTELLFSQLGITQDILNGTADEATMINYQNRTIKPLLVATRDEMKRKFLTKTARTQKQSIEFYREPFELVPMEKMAEIADKFTRNEIVSSNEVRGFIGMRPSSDPKADELTNSNMPQPAADPAAEDVEDPALTELGSEIDKIYEDLGVEEQ